MITIEEICKALEHAIGEADFWCDDAVQGSKAPRLEIERELLNRLKVMVDNSKQKVN